MFKSLLINQKIRKFYIQSKIDQLSGTDEDSIYLKRIKELELASLSKIDEAIPFAVLSVMYINESKEYGRQIGPIIDAEIEEKRVEISKLEELIIKLEESIKSLESMRKRHHVFHSNEARKIESQIASYQKNIDDLEAKIENSTPDKAEYIQSIIAHLKAYMSSIQVSLEEIEREAEETDKQDDNNRDSIESEITSARIKITQILAEIDLLEKEKQFLKEATPEEVRNNFNNRFFGKGAYYKSILGTNPTPKEEAIYRLLRTRMGYEFLMSKFAEIDNIKASINNPTIKMTINSMTFSPETLAFLSKNFGFKLVSQSAATNSFKTYTLEQDIEGFKKIIAELKTILSYLKPQKGLSIIDYLNVFDPGIIVRGEILNPKAINQARYLSTFFNFSSIENHEYSKFAKWIGLSAEESSNNPIYKRIDTLSNSLQHDLTVINDCDRRIKPLFSKSAREVRALSKLAANMHANEITNELMSAVSTLYQKVAEKFCINIDSLDIVSLYDYGKTDIEYMVKEITTELEIILARLELKISDLEEMHTRNKVEQEEYIRTIERHILSCAGITEETDESFSSDDDVFAIYADVYTKHIGAEISEKVESLYNVRIEEIAKTNPDELWHEYVFKS